MANLNKETYTISPFMIAPQPTAAARRACACACARKALPYSIEVRTRVPLTIVPFVLCRSLICHTPPSNTISACLALSMRGCCCKSNSKSPWHMPAASGGAPFRPIVSLGVLLASRWYCVCCCLNRGTNVARGPTVRRVGRWALLEKETRFFDDIPLKCVPLGLQSQGKKPEQ